MGKAEYHRMFSGLPPEEFRLIDKRDQIPTPLDSVGLVDVHQLILDVKATIDPAYVWPKECEQPKAFNDHHLYHPGADYPHGFKKRKSDTVIKFRNHNVNMVRMPIVFHNWLHRITIPPVIPSDESIHHRSQVWFTARDLYTCVRNDKINSRRRNNLAKMCTSGAQLFCEETYPYEQDPDYFADLDRRMEALDTYRERIRKIPSEFWLIDPELPTEELVRTVGKIAAPSALQLQKFIAA
ncbi:MAG: hypothetical protein NTX11_00730 [Candidatus Saccharibacteria bacterium]|nr:hypothetical protein [Candidatus Saccharibacteria bacterium]